MFSLNIDKRIQIFSLISAQTGEPVHKLLIPEGERGVYRSRVKSVVKQFKKLFLNVLVNLAIFFSLRNEYFLIIVT